MSMRRLSASRRLSLGFSLVELMIFAALLMCLLTIAYSSFNNLNPRVREIQRIRNAKNIVATANNALIAGAVFKGSTRNQVVDEVLQGIQPDRGIFKGKTFAVPNLSTEDLQDAALKYIFLSPDGTLGFDPVGKQAPR